MNECCAIANFYFPFCGFSFRSIAISLTAKHGALTLAMDNLAGSGSSASAEDAFFRVKVEISTSCFQFLGTAVTIGHGPATVIDSRWDARFVAGAPGDELKVRKPTRTGRS
jgi:hypothetical protein